MRLWNVLGLVFLAAGLAVNLGFEWDFFDLGAKTNWQSHLIGTLYLMVSLGCLGIDDVLQAIRANRSIPDD